MQLVLDSSVVVEGDWHLTGPAAEALLSSAAEGGCRLVVPEIVLREITAKYAEKEAKILSDLSKAQAKLERLRQGTTDPATDEPTPEGAHGSYSKLLTTRLEAADADWLPLPDVSHEDLLSRALGRRRPFDPQGQKGYRDALIWHTVLEIANDNELTVFASANARDFADEHDPTKPHPHLRDDLTARGIKEDAVRLCGSLQEAVQIIVEPAETLLYALRQDLADPEWHKSLIAWLVDAAENEGFDLDDFWVPFREPVEALYLDFDSAVMEDINPVSGVEFVNAYPISDTEFALSIALPCEIAYAITVDSDHIRHVAPALWRRINLSNDGRSASLTAYADATLKFSVGWDASERSFWGPALVDIGGAGPPPTPDA